MTKKQNGWTWTIVEDTDGKCYASWKKEGWPKGHIMSRIFDKWWDAFEAMENLGKPIDSPISMFFNLPGEFEVRTDGSEIFVFYNG